MQALVWQEAEHVVVRELAIPQLKPGYALVKVAYCGICGSDLEEYWHGPVMLPKAAHPLSGRSIPLTLGHEAAGMVVAVSPDEAGGISVGDRVCLESMRSCGRCRYCLNGQDYLCERLVCMGLQDDGAMAEYILAPTWACHPLSDDMTYIAGALVEPLSVVVHAWRIAGARAGESAVVYGAGMIGLGLVRMAVRNGVEVFVVEPDAGRRALALSFGAVEARSPDEGGAFTDRDMAFECSGRMEALRSAIDAVRKAGKVVAIGIHDAPGMFNPNTLIVKQVQLAGSVGNSREDYQYSFEWVREDFGTLQQLIGHVTTLEHVDDEGFRRAQGAGAGPKVLVRIGGDLIDVR